MDFPKNEHALGGSAVDDFSLMSEAELKAETYGSLKLKYTIYNIRYVQARPNSMPLKEGIYQQRYADHKMECMLQDGLPTYRGMI